jgi:glycosyltransferase involved in cell wall biosynthesis
MRISIAMATFQGAAHLREQLDSFSAQRRLPDELVVSDDCSSDETCEIVRDFSGSAPFEVRLEVNPVNLGLAENFSRALSMATGDLIFLSDQDDVWQENKIARMIELAEAHPNALCLMNDAWLSDGALNPSGQSKLNEIRAAGLSDRQFVMGCCAVLRRELLEFALPIPDLMWAHDNWLVGIADQVGRVERFAEPLQYYRLHGGNTSDFFVNRAKAQTKREELAERFKRGLARFSSTRGFEGEYRFHAAFAARLEERHSFGSQEMRRHVANRLSVLGARWDIRTRPRLSRIAPILRLLRERGYKGPLGPIKDMVLPAWGSRPDAQIRTDQRR